MCRHVFLVSLLVCVSVLSMSHRFLPEKNIKQMFYPTENIEENWSEILSYSPCTTLEKCFPNGPFNTEEDGIDAFRKRAQDFDVGLIVRNKETLAMTTSFWAPKDNTDFIFLFSICVDPEERRKGLAQRVIEKHVENVLEKRKKNQDRKTVVGLYIRVEEPSFTSVLSLYEKLGFVVGIKPCSDYIIAPVEDEKTLEGYSCIVNAPELFWEKYGKQKFVSMYKVLGESHVQESNAFRRSAKTLEEKYWEDEYEWK